MAEVLVRVGVALSGAGFLAAAAVLVLADGGYPLWLGTAARILVPLGFLLCAAAVLVLVRNRSRRPTPPEEQRPTTP
jgi:hypothetical protein